ncbi:hypothetical protein C8R43DRAFT_1046980 [Mycena crocata]|nr:hypothetical protein C8R43DRAFT_1046980 [Mycena crocata]
MLSRMSAFSVSVLPSGICVVYSANNSGVVSSIVPKFGVGLGLGLDSRRLSSESEARRLVLSSESESLLVPVGLCCRSLPSSDMVFRFSFFILRPSSFVFVLRAPSNLPPVASRLVSFLLPPSSSFSLSSNAVRSRSRRRDVNQVLHGPPRPPCGSPRADVPDALCGCSRCPIPAYPQLVARELREDKTNEICAKIRRMNERSDQRASRWDHQSP